MIVILDIGIGNPSSILNMLKKVGSESVLCKDIATLESATGIIFPGVGSFDSCVNALNNSGLKEALEKKVLKEKVPFLGICLGMQILFKSSEEGTQAGLGWVDGRVVKFKSATLTSEGSKKLRVPHMGWNNVNPQIKDSLISQESDQRFYFVHSYYASSVPQENVLATSSYGLDFVCAVQKDNITGTQFHPEKSHRFGMQLLKKFVEKCDV